MAKIGLLFPHQLFKDKMMAQTCDEIYLFEDELYFKQYNFHKQKLVLHRASMKYYADYIADATVVNYTPYGDKGQLEDIIQKHRKDEIHCYYTDDYLLERRLNRFCKRYGSKLVRYINPNFINTEEEVREALGKQKSYLMANFYAASRKKYGILLENDGKPLGGKWSFDADNRKKVPKGTIIPKIAIPENSSYVIEAKKYVEENFAENYGTLDTFFYPITHQAAEKHLERFVNERLTNFGDYEDAMLQEEHWLWHSVLTPMLNIGLLCPRQVINTVLLAHQKQPIPLNSLEGFIRQVLGWREFIRGIYTLEGAAQRTTNHFGYSRKIPRSFWDGTTGIAPIDDVIKKLLKTGYSHHIERLMILGNFMLLCEFDPDEVHRWFMEMYVDAYDWVMVPNVYGMTQYADGGLMTTKPYCSGSNYVLKMSDFKKGEWCEIWNSLYWRFIYVNKEEFSKNRRMGMMVNLAKKISSTQMEAHLQRAEEFFAQLEND